MSYGLEIKNTSGNIIIDSTYKNVQTAATGTAQPGDSYFVPGLLSSDLMMAKPNRASESILNCGRDFGQWGSAFPTYDPASYTYKILRPSVVSTGTGYGLEIFDASSNLCFSSNISESFEISATGSGVVSYAFFTPTDSIENYYVCMNPFYHITVFNTTWHMAVYNYNTNTISIEHSSTTYISYLIGKFIS